MSYQNSPATTGQDQTNQDNYTTLADAVSQLGGIMPDNFNPAAERTNVYTPAQKASGKPRSIVIYPDKLGNGHWVHSYGAGGKRIHCGLVGAPVMTSEEAEEAEARYVEMQEVKWAIKAEETQQLQRMLSAMPEEHRLKASFPYLERKKSPLDIVTGAGALADVSHTGAVTMFIFLRGGDYHEVVSYQKIDEAGNKRFQSGGRIGGSFVWVGASSVMMDYAKRGTPETQLPMKLLIAEGLATGVSVHLATGLPVCCALSAGNLLAVAKKVRRFYPFAQITIAGDDDRHTTGNPGRTKAIAAALEIGAKVVFPTWPDTWPEDHKATDFNDLVSMTFEVAA